MFELFEHNAKIILGKEAYNSQELQKNVLDISEKMMGIAVGRKVILAIEDEKEMALCFLAGGFTDLQIYIIHPKASLQKYDHLMRAGIPLLRSMDQLKNHGRKIKSGANPQMIFSTSNTTKAEIKWIHIPYDVLIKKAIMLKVLLETDKGSSTYLFSPLCFIQSCWSFIMFLYAGGTVFIEKYDFEYLVSLVVEKRINTLITVPSVARLLLTRKIDMSGMKMICLGGDFADKNLISSMSEAWPWLKYSNVYGCTETSAADIVLSPIYLDTNDKHIFSIGKQSWYSKVTIRKADLNELTAVNEPGVIWIEGEYVSKESLSVPEEGVGGFCTGDIGYRDEDNYYYFQGRNSGIIKYNGMKVSAFEVEAELRQHPYVKECVVFGTSCKTHGECINAAVCLTQDALFEELVNHLSNRLEKYKIPKYFYKTEEIQKTVSGKVCRQKEVLSGYVLPENLIL